MKDSIVYIENIFLKDKYIYIQGYDKDYSLFLKGNLNIFKAPILNSRIDIVDLINKNSKNIFREKEYSLICIEEKIEQQLQLSGYGKNKVYICKNKKIIINNRDIYIDIFIVDSTVKIGIKKIEDIKVIARLEDAIIVDKSFIISVNFNELVKNNSEGKNKVKLKEIPFNNLKDKEIYMLAYNEDRDIIKYECIEVLGNTAKFELDIEKISEIKDGKIINKCYFDNFEVSIRSEENIKLRKILKDSMNNLKKIVDFNIKNNSLIIENNLEVSINPKVSEVTIDNNVILRGDIGSEIQISKCNNIRVEVSFISRDNKQEFTRILKVDEENQFLIELDSEELANFNNLYSKEWDIEFKLIIDDEIKMQKELYYNNSKTKGILSKGIIKINRYTMYNQVYLTKNKKRVALKFIDPISINKIVRIKRKRKTLKIRIRFNNNIRKVENRIEVGIRVAEEYIKSSQVIIKGRKTALVVFNINNVDEIITKILSSGLNIDITVDGETFAKEIPDIDRDMIIMNLKERVFRSKKYKKLCRLSYKKVFLKMPIKKKKVLFESFLGRNISGNPKYIYEYMVGKGLDKKYDLIWILNNLDEEVSGNCKKVRRKSLLYYYHMATAKYWIFNTRQADEIIKRIGNIYLQTWHGTPLKRLAMDMDSVNMAGQTNIDKYKEKFYKNSRRWDYLLSQNNYSTEIFKRAFAFEKPILDYGYPANDILYNSTENDIENIKKKFNLPLDKKVILYAPTWRDNNFMKKGYYKMQVQLDLDRMTKELGDEYIILLRMHYLIMNSINIEDYNGVVYNFSQGYDIQELYLVSDILITDYSSVMFDYSNLNRPIIFFAYDIEDYRDSLRGFYFDFESEAPGPIVKTTDEVIHCIKNIDEVNYEYKENKEKFYDKFCHIDNGNSAEKIVAKIFNK